MITRDEIAELIGVRVGHGKGERSARAVGQVGFTDVAASVAAHLGIASQGPGKSFL